MNRQTRKQTMPAPRNPYFAVAGFRRAGSHRKTGKALRRTEKMADQRAVDDPNRYRSDDHRPSGSCSPVQSADKSESTLLSAF